ncbi:MAG: hypothetical protein ACE5HR_00215 [bacterium]
MKIREYTIPICDSCYDLQGEMCHTPRCVFIRHTMSAVKELLNILQIRIPGLEGESVIVQNKPPEYSTK